jgi:sugar phosphate isomerase/epimerase
MLIGNPMIYRQLPLEMALAKCVSAGYDALELWPPQIAECRTSELRRQLHGYAQSLGMELIRLNCADRDYFQSLQSRKDARRALDGLTADTDAAADLRMSQLLTWEGRAAEFSTDEVFGRVLDDTTWLFQEACRYASARSIELTVEVHPFTLGINLTWLTSLCDRLSDQPFTVTYDCCHFAVGLPDDYINAIDRLGRRIGHVHFSDSDVQSSELHFAPGTGCLDLDGIVAALRRIGFKGTMMLDLWLCPLPEWGTEVGLPVVRQACQSLGIDSGRPHKSTASKQSVP